MVFLSQCVVQMKEIFVPAVGRDVSSTLASALDGLLPEVTPFPGFLSTANDQWKWDIKAWPSLPISENPKVVYQLQSSLWS